ncbi:MAG TPA: TonB-dependent receptor [Woeseiaceae bacterium]|nr:TonB-dependent receptor [Woeseiaceae bacterium]
MMLSIYLGLAATGALAAVETEEVPIEVVEVVGQTPLGAGLDIDQIATNVQSATAEEIRKKRALSLADFMNRSLGSVFVNEAQSNPLQPDLQYRGFVGSPLLGLAQGIAVYQDGVRINEPFGDTVNWALIPESAINTVYLMPGSNPLFGLNALGGSVAINTKNGFSSPGTKAKIYGGSYGRLGAQAETGGSSGESFSHFFTASYLEEDGWRNYSPTEATQLFGDLGWRSDKLTTHLKFSAANTDLIGNGAAPVELLETDRTSIFTRPDQTRNQLRFVNLIGNYEASSDLTLDGNVYMRASDIDSYNGDDSDFEECDANPGFMCEIEADEEKLVLDQHDNYIQANQNVDGATINRTSTEQTSIGFGIQAAWRGDLDGRNNLFAIGMAFDDSKVDFAASTELGQLDDTRLAVPSGFFVRESFTKLSTETRSLGFYLSNVLSISESTTLTVAGRYNDIGVKLRDQLGTALNGDHDFRRFNPAIGITTKLAGGMTLYAGYSESNRAPSPVELTCADEDDPCRLPNAFLSDPPLDQVVASTYEIGIRGDMFDASWHTGIFQTTSNDDILFVSAGALTNEGFFENVGRTRRKGLEINVDGILAGSATWFINYTYLDAQFRESLTLPSPHSPAAINGEIFVAMGDKLPLVPAQLLKMGIQFNPAERLVFAGDVLANSGFYMRGDEGNDRERIGSFAVLNLRADYQINEQVQVFLNIDNVLDEKYETFGLFGDATEVLGPAISDKRFFSPGMPRAAWIGVQLTL